VPLDHRLYHFRLAFSGWEHAHVVKLPRKRSSMIGKISANSTAARPD
jgi:hypothetical protein